MALGCVPTNSAKLRSSPCAWRCSNPNTSCTALPRTHYQPGHSREHKCVGRLCPHHQVSWSGAASGCLGSPSASFISCYYPCHQHRASQGPQ